MGPVRARWFDGRSSQPRQVLVSLHAGPQGPSLHLHDLGGPGTPARVFAPGQADWPPAWSASRSPRTVIVDLHDQGSLEIDDPALWHESLAAAGGRASLAQRMQTRWRVFAAVLVLAAVALTAFYRWGTPWAATQLSRHVPLSWETELSARAMNDLDRRWLKPSQLPAERQAQLRQRFDALAQQVDPGLRRYSGYAPRLTLAFRRGMGANAFALPGGTIVMTDGLVEAAAKQGLPDEALVGVLAHEIGHVMHRHTTRLVVEQGVLNVGLSLALGDVSTVAATGSALLTGLAYRRAHETEADCFAAALMRKAQLPVAPMADLLLGMEGERGAGRESASPAWTSLLSSHPQTAERALKLKQGQAPGC